MHKIFIFLLLALGLLSACAGSAQKTNNSAQATNKQQKAPTDAYRQVSLPAQRKRAQYEAHSENIMIASQGSHTTQAALQILEQGGNLFDAAVAMSFVISVERPHSTGLGGGGFMLIHEAASKKTQAYDFRETAPAKAQQNMYLDQQGHQVRRASLDGGLAVATPGLVRGLLEIHKNHGQLPRAQVLEPAITLAEQGFKVYPHLSKAIKARAALLKQQGAAHIFFTAQGQPLAPGDILVQAELAATLKRISKFGAAEFYTGATAQAIVNSVQQHGGILSARDLEQYRIKVRQPVWGSYKGYKIASMPPPSSGGVHIIQMLNILESFQQQAQHSLKTWGAQDPRTVHTVVSAMQLAYADRAKYLGDSDFSQVPVQALISKQYAKSLVPFIKPHTALVAEDLLGSRPLPHESSDTTHFTLMDKHGNTISSTQTINGWFGSALVAKGTGIILNNEMDDFASHVGGVNLFGAIGGQNNLIEAYKRPLSSMSPTLIFAANEEPVLALGTPSGTRIINCVMQTILNRLEFDLPLYESVHLTRYHHQWQPDELRIETPLLPVATLNKLKGFGHSVAEKDLGCKVQAVERTQYGLVGVSDIRGEGLAKGE